MVQYPLIDGYLDTVRTRARRRDINEVLAELEDHLYSTVEVLIGEGVESGLAQRQTLERFGNLDAMADSFASPIRGGPAVPTRFTKRSGSLAVIGGVLWFTTAGVWWAAGVAPPWGRVDFDSVNTASGVLYGIGAASLLAACVLTFVTAVALNRRHGGLGTMGRVGLAFCGLSVIGAFAAWIFIGWGSMLMIGTILTAIPVTQRGIAPRLPTYAFGIGLAAGGITRIILRAIDGTLGEGWVGLWGDVWIPNLIGVTVAAVLLGLGLVGIGAWLREEVAIEADTAARPLTI
jgi:hypothetical protein